VSDRDKNMGIIRGQAAKGTPPPHRQRDKRMARALTRLQQLRRPATALEIGDACCRASAARIARGNARQSVLANSHLAYFSQDGNHPTHKE
jgi:hypothetical protein